MRTAPARKVLNFLLLGRPHFLLGGVALSTLGVAMARHYGTPIELDVWLWGQLAITSTQWMTHYSNDYFDLAGDRVNAASGHWSGGSGVLVDGRVAPATALTAAIALSVAAVAALAVLLLVHGAALGVVAAGLAALVLSWAYSAPPVRLHSRGVGEVVATLIVAVATPLFAFALQSERLVLGAVLATVPLSAATFAMLLSVTVSDAAADATVGKRTLVVRLGTRTTARLHATVLAAAYALLPLLAWLGMPPAAAAAPVVVLPLALCQVRRVDRLTRAPYALPARVAFWGVVVFAVTVVAEAAAFALLPAQRR